jgi:hypothetical protein
MGLIDHSRSMHDLDVVRGASAEDAWLSLALPRDLSSGHLLRTTHISFSARRVSNELPKQATGRKRIVIKNVANKMAWTQGHSVGSAGLVPLNGRLGRFQSAACQTTRERKSATCYLADGSLLAEISVLLPCYLCYSRPEFDSTDSNAGEQTEV